MHARDSGDRCARRASVSAVNPSACDTPLFDHADGFDMGVQLDSMCIFMSMTCAYFCNEVIGQKSTVVHRSARQVSLDESVSTR